MLQFDVALCRARDNVAHLSACACLRIRDADRNTHRQVMYDATRTDAASEFISDVEGFIPKGTHIASTNNRLIRLRRISAFLTLSSLKGIKRRIFMK